MYPSIHAVGVMEKCFFEKTVELSVYMTYNMSNDIYLKIFINRGGYYATETKDY